MNSQRQPIVRTNRAGPRRQQSAPGFVLPSGSCDSHLHVLGPYARHPLLVTRSVEPPEAPLEAYREAVWPLGIERVVVVQPSVYGTDNACLLEALAALGPAGRGVAVIEPALSDAALEALHRQGVRGVRLQAVVAGGQSLEQIEAVAQRIAPLGWHLQLFLDAATLPPLMPLLRRLAVPLVFDHMAQVHADSGEDEPGFQALLALLATGRAWVKLGHCYHAAPANRAQALFAANPRQCLWGSDWPHMAEMKGGIPDEGLLLARLGAWFPDPAARRAILAENPARLYFQEGGGDG